MPKASFARSDAVEVSLGVQEGFIEVIGSLTKIHQYPANSKTGKQSDPFCCVQLEVLRLNEKGERLDEDAPILEQLSVGGQKDGQFKFHPGLAKSASDDDPEDLGIEVDVEGNCLYVEEGGKLNKKCTWHKFTDSLEEKGFKPDVLANGFMPDLIGLKCHVHTVIPAKDANDTQEKRGHLIVDKVLQFPYDAKKVKKATPAPAKAAAKSAPTPKAEPADTNLDPEAIAVAKLTTLLDDPQFANKAGIERKKIQTTVQTKLMREQVPTKLHKPVMDLIKSDEWLTAQTMELEDSPLYGRIAVDFEAGTADFV